MSRILFYSGSIGLGHVKRDLAIAEELRKIDKDIEIEWLAGYPAISVLEDANQKILKESKEIDNGNSLVVPDPTNHKFRFSDFMMKVRDDWNNNLEVYKRVTKQNHYDLFIGDETYELATAWVKDQSVYGMPFILIWDHTGMESMSWSPKERLVTYMVNRTWAKGFSMTKSDDRGLFVGEKEDVPDGPFGFLLPNRKTMTVKACNFIGYILEFKPEDYSNPTEMKRRLGYEGKKLIVCTIGGTAVGKGLLDLCKNAYPIIKQKAPEAVMLLVGGPSLGNVDNGKVDGLEYRGYVPRLFEYLAASDITVTLGGATTGLELTALKRPFIYFPMEGHYEQQRCVAKMLERHRAGIRMSLSQTSPTDLAKAIIDNMGKKVDYADIPTEGARLAAQLIHQRLGG